MIFKMMSLHFETQFSERLQSWLGHENTNWATGRRSAILPTLAARRDFDGSIEHHGASRQHRWKGKCMEEP